MTTSDFRRSRPLPSPVSRRRWLAGGLSLAAAGLPGARLAFGATARDGAASGAGNTAPRLVVVLLRGALDGLAAVPAIGDPQWAALRPQAQAEAERIGAPLALDSHFALHPQLAQLHRWWGDGQLTVLHAVAQPYRERSHFDAQQQLESGGERPFALDTGWLGRALAAAGQPSLALLPSVPLALRGSPQASNWAPSREREADDDLLTRLHRLYASDAQLAPLWTRALAQRGMVTDLKAGAAAPSAAMVMSPAPAPAPSIVGAGVTAAVQRPGGFSLLARQAGKFLSHPEGPRLAWLESGGWDTHSGQSGRLVSALGGLDEGLAALRESLGEHWATTTVLVMTEFGRSAAMNGSGGTDHGTGSVAFLAGGRVRGGRVLSDWPGLTGAQLLDGRDLRPTLDLRRLQRAVLEAHWPLGRTQIERDILPGAPAALPDLFHA